MPLLKRRVYVGVLWSLQTPEICMRGADFWSKSVERMSEGHADWERQADLPIPVFVLFQISRSARFQKFHCAEEANTYNDGAIPTHGCPT